ncbi:uncharacterized protein [Lepeophtheirus salmonis]|uniref:uncharacterized protein isoform X1 n=1 Tax=Lepeophtheirus salmonis TaxID=72036 RepID=UPI001AE45FF0|nr:uncharacterized protein LOC121115628 isoform X1 [Lepeophtheirus salmonis]
MRYFFVLFFFLVLDKVFHGDCCQSRNSLFSRERLSLPQKTKLQGSPKSSELYQKTQQIILLNSPGDRFTATHGISAVAGQHQYFEVEVSANNLNYFEVTANIARGRGSNGGVHKFELYMSRDYLPTPDEFDMKSEVSATSSYIAQKLYSKNIHVDQPGIGRYYILLVSQQDFNDLLITTITDFRQY